MSTVRRLLVASAGAAVFATPLLAASGEKPSAPSLNDVLTRLGQNLQRFDRTVPSFFCEEQVISLYAGEYVKRTITDSTFRVRRVTGDDGAQSLEESRDVRLVDGKPDTEKKAEAPAMLDGAFEGSLAVVSADQARCMRYTLERVKGKAPQSFTIRFETALTEENKDRCFLDEQSKGRVVVDAATMQVRRVQITTPHHVIIPARVNGKAIIGKRVLAVDYAPVSLEGLSFWMPQTITMQAVSGEGRFDRMLWSFRASYGNYHKLEVKSRILP